MKFCVDKLILGSNQSLLFDGFNYVWTDNLPSNVWNLSNNRIDGKYDLKSALYLCGNKIEDFKPGIFYKSMSLLTQRDNLPWEKIIPKEKYYDLIKEYIHYINEKCENTNFDYYNNVFLKGDYVLSLLQKSKINIKIYDYLMSNDIIGVNKKIIDSFKPDENGYANNIRYNRLKTISGRLIVEEGPEILLLNKDLKNIIKSRYKNGNIYQFDYISLEPRLALYCADIKFYEDIYDKINDIIFDKKLTREKAKIICLSVLYGSGIEKISNSIDIDIKTCQDIIVPKIKSFFKIYEKTFELKKQYDNFGYIKNLFGRAIYPDKNSERKFYNYYIQSSCVDLSLLGFYNAVFNIIKEIEYLFVIHDNLIVDCQKSNNKTIDEIINLCSDICGYKYPIGCSII